MDAAQSYCPVLNVSESVYAYCLGLLVKNASVLYDVLSPGIALEDDEYTVITLICNSELFVVSCRVVISESSCFT